MVQTTDQMYPKDANDFKAALQIPLTPPKTSLKARINIDMGGKRRETCQTKGQDVPLIEIEEFPPTWLMDIELGTEDNRTPENAIGRHDVKLVQNNVPETNTAREGPNPATRLLETAETVSTINRISIYKTEVATRFSLSQEPGNENGFDGGTPHEGAVEEQQACASKRIGRDGECTLTVSSIRIGQRQTGRITSPSMLMMKPQTRTYRTRLSTGTRKGRGRRKVLRNQ
jgi:hypothetical protein